MRRFALPLVALVACHGRNDGAAPLDLGPDLAEIGFGEPFQIEARAEPGDVVWTQVAGPKLVDVVATPRRFSARMPPLGDDPLHRPLGDAHVSRNLPQANTGVARDAEQHLRVVRDEGPALRWLT